MQSIVDSKWLVFIKVAELGSLTRAADALDMPQSMVSRNIGELERRIGSRIFRRTGRGVVLTEFGEQLYPRIKALAAEADSISDAIRTSGSVPVGEVRLGLLPFSVPQLAAKLYAVVRQRYQQVQLHMIEGTSVQLEEQLRDGRIDMALLLREGAEQSAGESLLAQAPLHLFGKKGSEILQAPTIELDRISGVPLVVPSRPHPLRARLDSLAEVRGLKLNIAVEADSIRLQYEIAAAGGGFAITGGMFDLRQDDRLEAVRIVKPELLRSVVLATTLRRPHTLATREIQRLLAQVVPPLLAGN